MDQKSSYTMESTLYNCDCKIANKGYYKVLKCKYHTTNINYKKEKPYKFPCGCIVTYECFEYSYSDVSSEERYEDSDYSNYEDLDENSISSNSSENEILESEGDEPYMIYAINKCDFHFIINGKKTYKIYYLGDKPFRYYRDEVLRWYFDKDYWFSNIDVIHDREYKKIVRKIMAKKFIPELLDIIMEYY
jgi:hypothetical protein